jgi:hypothetical protein
VGPAASLDTVEKGKLLTLPEFELRPLTCLARIRNMSSIYYGICIASAVDTDSIGTCESRLLGKYRRFG